MNSPPVTSVDSLVSSNDENQPRVKFLCSFSGSILPRPQDGKLRYVGGETRIVSVPRDITYEDLMVKMREIYEGAMVLKYQQPDEDLDALVSVVNDDDVINMMEEYDKLGSGDGFTKLRIFLFSYADMDGSVHFIDADERETERLYVDALNSLNDDAFNQMSLDGGFYNLRHLNIPHIGSGQFQQMDGPYSPAIYSPMYSNHDPRPAGEFPISPSSGRYRSPYGDLSDRNFERMYDNVVWGPPDRSGFPGNILHSSNAYEGHSVCEHCRRAFQRNQTYPEIPNMGSGFLQVPSSCSECLPNREHFVPQADTKFQYGLFSREQNDARGFYNEAHNYERGYVMPAQSSSRLDAPGMNIPNGTSNFLGGHHVKANYAHPEDSRFIRSSPDLGNELLHNHTFYQVPQGPSPAHTLRRHVHTPSHVASPYEVSHSPPFSQSNGLVSPVVRASREGSPRISIGADIQKTWVDPSQKMVAVEGSAPHENSFSNQQNVDQNSLTEENSSFSINMSKFDTAFESLQLSGLTMAQKNLDEVACPESANLSNLDKENNGSIKMDEDNEASNGLSLPADLISSENKSALEDDKDVNVKAPKVDDLTAHEITTKEESNYKSEAADVNGGTELGSDYENTNNSKIEPTKAEEEAIEKGLQTIKNDDLEEIKVLGSGTYGAVYHGKWRGSDVAIKRIKASCFAGRPSERERLIADFWKEALILSSLHHPNVVAFYGIVRDGPDGSLATVTEFMINGSLKQFLHKKDRTIDRRKRVILAMDAAFGMEYLHGKNIVHFDLKCENLLVNMRDPHRPVCKIGDLGLSKVKQHTLVSGGVRGTLPWMAPELLSGKNNMVTEKIDVYSFGIVMWELLTGDEPYADLHCASIIGGIVNNGLRPTTPTWCDPEWKSLMESCWASEPSERPSFSDISQRLRNMAAAMNVK